MSCKVIINTIELANTFVKINEGCKYDVEVTDGRWLVDGKSILGVLSLNLLNPLSVEIIWENDEIVDKYRSAGILVD